MNERPATRVCLVIGHGLVGRSVSRRLNDEATTQVETLNQARWERMSETQQLITESVHNFLDSYHSAERVIVWTAGISTPRSSLEEIRADEALFGTLLEACRDFRSKSQGSPEPIKLFFASSAGGVYARSKYPPFDELTDPEPDSHYGESKLACESELRKLASDTDIKCIIGRLTTVYGEQQNPLKPQGILSHLVANSARRQATTITAPLDSVRNYIYAGDAGRLVVHHLRFSDASVRIANICSPFNNSLSSVIETVRSVVRFRTTLKMTHSLLHSHQPTDLRVRSVSGSLVQSLCRTSLAEGVHKILQVELRRLERSVLR